MTDWSSYVCSSDHARRRRVARHHARRVSGVRKLSDEPARPLRGGDGRTDMEQLDGGRDAVSAAGIRALFRFARPAQRLPASAMANRGGWLTQLPAGAVRQVHRRLEIVEASREIGRTSSRERVWQYV